MNLNNFISNRYDYLHECSYNILKRIKRTDLAESLVTNAYLYLKEKDLSNLSESEIESYFINFMNKQVLWRDTKFKKEFVYENYKHNCNVDINTLRIQDDSISYEEEVLKLKETQDKVSNIYLRVHSQTLDQKILFNKYFVDGQTEKEIADELNTSRSTIHKMIVNLKIQIKMNEQQKTIYDKLSLLKYDDMLDLANELAEKLEGCLEAIQHEKMMAYKTKPLQCNLQLSLTNLILKNNQLNNK